MIVDGEITLEYMRKNPVRGKEIGLAHGAINYWMNWTMSHIHISRIGYPSRTIEASILEGVLVSSGLPGPKEPEVIMPLSVCAVERVIRQLGYKYRVAVECEYSIPQTHKALRVVVFKRLTGLGRTTYYDVLRRVKHAVALDIRHYRT